MEISRREFVKGISALLGIASFSQGLLLLQNILEPISKADPGEYDRKHYWGFVCDIDKCIGCGRCVKACKLENHVPKKPEYNRTWVERYVISEEGEVFLDSPEGGINGFAAAHLDDKYKNLQIRKSYFVPKLCNHCDNPPCVWVCPVSATYMTKDGVVLVDQKRCIGCAYCVIACPYGARYMVPPGDETPMGYVGVVDKCTWCYHRITKGLQPACVEACPVEARIFGDLRDPESPVRKILRDKWVSVLKPALGAKPKVYYIGLEPEVR